MERLAERAFDMLEEIGTASQAGGDAPGPQGAHLVFAGELVVGETCGCPIPEAAAS